MLSGRKPLNDAGKHLWQWFIAMRREAGSGPINARVMQDWQWLTGNRLNMIERRIIGEIETLWRRTRD